MHYLYERKQYNWIQMPTKDIMLKYLQQFDEYKCDASSLCRLRVDIV